MIISDTQKHERARVLPRSPRSKGIDKRLRALRASAFILESLPERSITLDLARKPMDGEFRTETGPRLLSFLSEAGLPTSPVAGPRGQGEGLCLIDAASIPGLRAPSASAGLSLGIALYLVSGIRAFACGHSEGNFPFLGLHEPGRGLSLAACRLIEDRFAWLAANAVLVGEESPQGAKDWIGRLASAFRADYGA